MTLNDGFERTVSDWLDEQAGRGAPGYLDEVLARTTRSRQRPWWSSLERWLPVQTTLRFAPAPRAAWLLVVLALVAALAVAVLAIGSRPRLPDPFGPARNGAVVTSGDGDIFSVDPVTGARTPLIADPAFDFGAVFSRDGTKFYFLRASDPTNVEAGLELVVANADGTGVRTLSPAVSGLDWHDWSPDGRQIAFLSRPKGAGTAAVINVVNVDGSGLRTLDVGRPAFYPSWLPPDGKEIVFRGERLQAGDPPPGIFAVHPDGTGLRPVSTMPAVGDDDYQNPSVSPDGTRVAYTGSRLDACCSVHILDMASGIDRILPAAAGDAGELGPVFSPDGTSIAYLRYTQRGQFQIVVARADGTGTRTSLGPLGPQAEYGPSINNYAFTPDGTAVMAGYDDEHLVRVLPVDGSAGTVLSRGDFTSVTYQRLAP